jgi:glutathione S-transferase
MIKIYHIEREGDPFGGSRNSCKVLIALSEIGERYEMRALSRLNDCRPEDAPYRKINPNGVTPSIDDDGFVLWESGAVLRYLGESRPGETLLPADPQSRATVQQWVSWEGATLAPSLLGLFFATMSPTPDAAATAMAKAAYLANLAILNKQLSQRAYVCDNYSIADIAIGSLTPISFLLGLDLAEYPNILAWLRRLRKRPAWRVAEAVMADMDAGQAQLGQEVGTDSGTHESAEVV